GPAISSGSGYFAGDIPNVAPASSYPVWWISAFILLLALVAIISIFTRRIVAARATNPTPPGTPSPRVSPISSPTRKSIEFIEVDLAI
ncbi:hypothetical protein MKW92_000966, partial [Papaver armeniacum]